MLRRLKVVAVAGLVLGAFLAMPHPALAHALAQSSVPPPGAVLNEAPATVTITFGEAPDPRLSSIAVVDTSGAGWTSGRSIAVPGDPDQLEVRLKPLRHGVYTVTWRTVSSVDGHLASGSFAFGVGVAPTAAQTAAVVAAPPPSGLAVVARLLLFSGLMLVLGVAAIALFVFRQRRRVTAQLAAAGALLAVAGSVLVIEAQRSAAGISWGDVFGSSLGTSFLERAIFAVLLLLASVAISRRDRPRLHRGGLVVAGVAALGAMAVDVFSSHAGAESPVLVNELVQWLHVVAAGVWVGGLAILLFSVRGGPSPEKSADIRRFSFLAGIAIVVVAASGVVRAVLEIGTWSGLFSTVFGELVIIKAALLVVIIGLGAMNRYRHLPISGLRLGGLRVAGSLEMIVATAAVLVAAALVNVAPPVAAQTTAVAQQSLTVRGSDAATTVRAGLTLTPGTPGFNTFTLTLSDYDSGQPVSADAVKLSFSSLDLPTLGGSTLLLEHTGPGTYTAQGANLALAGRWRIAVLVERGAESTEVDLSATLRTAPPKIDVQRFGGGLPTLYTVHLSQGGTVQVYLDPDAIGATHFHATFFDAKGQELPIASITMAVSHGGAAPIALTPQRLDSGHFVANVTLIKGSSHFTVAATTAGGDQLATALDLTPTTQ